MIFIFNNFFKQIIIRGYSSFNVLYYNVLNFDDMPGSGAASSGLLQPEAGLLSQQEQHPYICI